MTAAFFDAVSGSPIAVTSDYRRWPDALRAARSLAREHGRRILVVDPAHPSHLTVV